MYTCITYNKYILHNILYTYMYTYSYIMYYYIISYNNNIQMRYISIYTHTQ